MSDSQSLYTRYTVSRLCQQANGNEFLAGGYLAGKDFKDQLVKYRLALAAKRGEDVRPASIAREIGVTRAAYDHWEKGRRVPRDVKTLRKLAHYFGVDESDFNLTIVEPASPSKEKQQVGLARDRRVDAEPGDQKRKGA